MGLGLAILIGAGIAAVSGIAGAAINAYSTDKANRDTNESNEAVNQAQIDYANQVNEKQIEFNKNAYSYATADKMRSGLSPLDPQAALSPSLQMPSLTPTKFEATDAGNQIAQAGNNAVAAYNSTRSITSEVGLNNAKSLNTQADTVGKQIDNMEQWNTLNDRIDQTREEVKKLKTENEFLADEKQSQLDTMETQRDLMRNQIEDIQSGITRQDKLAEKSLEKSDSEIQLNNATSAYRKMETVQAEYNVINDLRSTLWKTSHGLSPDTHISQNFTNGDWKQLLMNEVTKRLPANTRSQQSFSNMMSTAQANLEGRGMKREDITVRDILDEMVRMYGSKDFFDK